MARIKQIIAFLGMFALILAAIHIYMFERLDFYLQPAPDYRMGMAILLSVLPSLTLVSLPLSRLLPRSLASVLTWIVFPWMGVTLLLFVTLIAADIVWITGQFLPINQLHDVQFVHCIGATALAVAAFLCVIAFWNGLRTVSTKNVTVTLRRLPKSLDGLRIVQVSDIHIGPLVGRKWLQKIVSNVNALNPDLVVITGDLVDGTVEELHSHVVPLADLRSRLGTYFITGNHEYYSDVESWCDHIAGLGIKVLRNERVSISSMNGEESFDLVGVDDWGSRHLSEGGPNLSKALEGRDTTKTVILLAHQPAAVDEAAAHGVDLMLSGHTHAGQIWPFHYLVYLQQPYIKGLHRHRESQTQIYISAGTGFWGPPMRLGTTAEITHITLRSA